MKAVNRKIQFHYFVFAIILVVGIFFRFYNYPNRISMGLDSARDAFVSLEGAANLQFPLTGPFISIAPVTTGPWYWTQLILARILLPTSYAPWLLLAIYSTLMIVIMYKIGVLLQNSTLGLILAFITALSPNQISNAVGLTNPAVIGFFTSLVLYITLKLVKNGPNGKTGFILGIILGITINTHYQTMGLLSLPLALIVFRKKYIKTLFLMFIGISLSFIPLFFFELNNHWFNSRGMLKYLLVDQYNIYTPMSWKIYISDYWPRFISYVLGGDKIFGFVIMIAIAFVFGLKVLKGRLEKTQLLIIISFIIEVVIIRYYRGERYFGYLQFFHPYIIYLTGYTINNLFGKKFIIFSIPILILYTIFVLPSSISALTPEGLTTDTIKLSNEIQDKFGKGKFKLFKCSKLVKPEVVALTLSLEMRGVYSSDGKPLIYFWGCNYPEVFINSEVINDSAIIQEKNLIPMIGFVGDVSLASESAIIQKGWVETSPKSAYQSAARWWFDEQP